MRKIGKIAVAVADPRHIATSILWGRTDHSAFKLSLSLAHMETSISKISRSSDVANVLKQS